MPGGQLLLLVAMFALMYFLMIRPQKKRQQKEKEVRESLKVGDMIVTIGGMRGRVTNLTDDSFEIETGSDHVRVEYLRQALSYIVKPAEGYKNIKDAEDLHDDLTDEEVVLEEEELDDDKE